MQKNFVYSNIYLITDQLDSAGLFWFKDLSDFFVVEKSKT